MLAGLHYSCWPHTTRAPLRYNGSLCHSEGLRYVARPGEVDMFTLRVFTLHITFLRFYSVKI